VIALLLAFGMIALLCAIVVVALSMLIALGLKQMFPHAAPGRLSHLCAAVLPVALSIWILASIYEAQPSDHLNGPAAQGIAGMAFFAIVTSCVAWPLGFYAARRVIESSPKS
tara:strand:+ start:39 stop:374 length:336 start_codon:yes stop_codon:yes gene_type:complete